MRHRGLRLHLVLVREVYPEGEHERRDARRRVDDHAAREVDDAVLREPPVVVEDPVREGAVDEEVPDRREGHEVDVPAGEWERRGSEPGTQAAPLALLLT